MLEEGRRKMRSRRRRRRRRTSDRGLVYRGLVYTHPLPPTNRCIKVSFIKYHILKYNLSKPHVTTC